MTESETPASAVEAPWVCTSMRGMSPATAVKAAETSSRTAITVGTPRASRVMPWGSARMPPTTTSTVPPMITRAPERARVGVGEERGGERRHRETGGEQQGRGDPTAFGCRGVGIRSLRTTRVGAPQRRPQQRERDRHDEQRGDEHEPPPPHGVDAAGQARPEQRGQDPGGGERREHLGAQRIRQGLRHEHHERGVDERLGGARGGAAGDEDRHRRRETRDDLGDDERGDPPEQHRARARSGRSSHPTRPSRW